MPLNTVHLLYCGLQINNNRGNHYDALLPIISSSNNPSIVNVTANTQTSVSEDTEKDLQSSQSTLVSDPDSISWSFSSNEPTTYTETLFSNIWTAIFSYLIEKEFYHC